MSELPDVDRVLVAVRRRPGQTAAEIGRLLSPSMGRDKVLRLLNGLEDGGKVFRETGQHRVGWHPREAPDAS